MNYIKEYKNRRTGFIEKVPIYFQFLCNEYGFKEPIYNCYEQSKGIIIGDKFEYCHLIKGKVILISNSYHPNDYGYEVYLNDLINDNKELLDYVLQDYQDSEQKYLKN